MILHLVTTLDTGGAERIVYELAARTAVGNEPGGTAVVAFSGGGVYAEKLRARNIAVYDLRTSRKFQIFSALFRLRKLLKKLRPAILHTHLFHANFIGRIAAIGLQISVLSTCQIMEMRAVPWHFWLEKITARLASYEVCVSHCTAKFQQQKTGLPADFFPVIYNSVDLNKFRPAENREQRELWRRELNFPTAPLIGGFLGRLHLQKGVDILFSALHLLPEKYRAQFAIVIGGAGDEEKNLRALAVEKKLTNVFFLGYQTLPEKFLAACDFCVMPSRYEGFSLVALETLACNTALIVSDIPALAEALTDRATALFFQSADPRALAEKIRILIDDPELRKKLATAGRDAAQNFCVEKMVVQYQQLYQRIIAGAQ